MLDDEDRPTYSEMIEVGTSTDGAVIGIEVDGGTIEMEIEMERGGVAITAPITLSDDEALSLAHMLIAAYASCQNGTAGLSPLTVTIADYRDRIAQLESAIRDQLRNLQPQDGGYDDLRTVVQVAGFGGPA